MDVLSRLLEPIRIRGSVFCHGPVCSPWRFEGGAAGLCLFHCVVEGSAWMTVAKQPPVRLSQGDVVLLPRGGRHCMGSGPRGRAVPLRDAVSETSLDAPFARFRIGGDGPTSHLICGSFMIEGMDWHPLLRALPDTIVVNAGVGRWLSPTLVGLERFLDAREPGAELIAQKLTDILFVQTLASWLSGQNASESWLRALCDDQVGRVIGLIHARPAEPWSVERLAHAAGMSRSAFFNRFRDLVGEPPAKYLLRWRMTLAARALLDEGLSVAAVCDRVGYASVPSFTHAFRKHHGQTPAAFRRATG